MSGLRISPDLTLPLPVEIRVPEPVLTDEHARLLIDLAKKLSELDATIAPALRGLPTGAKVGAATARGGTSTGTPAATRTAPIQAGTPHAEKRPPVHPQPGTPGPADAPKLGKAEKNVLTVLATFTGRNRKQLAALAQLRAGGGHFGNVLSSLRKAGYITGDGQGPYEITDAGRDALGGNYTTLPTGRALLDWWLEQLGRAHRDVLITLVNNYPDSVGKAELAAAVSVDAGGGHYGNVLSQLRTRDLITGSSSLRADDDFMAAINA